MEKSWVVPQAKAELQLVALNLQQTWTGTHSTKYFAPNGGKVVNLFGLAVNKAVNYMMK